MSTENKKTSEELELTEEIDSAFVELNAACLFLRETLSTYNTDDRAMPDSFKAFVELEKAIHQHQTITGDAKVLFQWANDYWKIIHTLYAIEAHVLNAHDRLAKAGSYSDVQCFMGVNIPTSCKSDNK